MKKRYSLPSLSYDYKDLEPFISEEQLMIHHQKHHQAYVNGANAIFEIMDEARKNDSEIDMKSTLKSLAFNIAGHKLHSLFWENLTPVKENNKEPKGKILEMIENEFGSFSRFKKEFINCALSVEGSGWAVLSFDRETERLVINQIEKHGNNIHTSLKILMVVDMFEHAYYIDYKNDKSKFVDNCWQLIDWEVVEKRIISLF